MTNKNCARCEKTVYPIEELKCLDKVFHKTCFKCHECNMILNMKTYKGFNKQPYCSAHCPRARATTVAESIESKRLAENTKNQSNVKYHEDFEKQKGKLTQVADDPETLRIRNTSKIISNATYHGEYEKKKQMEERRTLIGGVDENVYNNNINAAIYHQYSSSTQPSIGTAAINNNNNNHPHHQANIKSQPQQQQQVPQQQYVKTPIANASMILDNHHQRNPMFPSNNNNNSNNLNQTDINNKNYYNNNDKLSGNMKNSPAYYHQVQQDVPTRVGYMNPGNNPMMPTGQHHHLNHHHQPQQQQQQQIPQYHQQSPSQPPQAFNPKLVASAQYPQQQQQQQQQQKYYPVPQDYGPQAQQAMMYPGSVYDNQQYRIQQQQPQPQQQPISPQKMRQQSNLGLCFRAIYDYKAQDDDEVTFMDGDLIVNCQPIDDGWMTGTVQRTGQTGMLPSNYVETV